MAALAGPLAEVSRAQGLLPGLVKRFYERALAPPGFTRIISVVAD